MNPPCDTDCHGKRVVAAQGIVKQSSSCEADHASEAKVPLKHTPVDKAGEPSKLM